MSASEISFADPARRLAFDRWIAECAVRHGLVPASLRSASADASFRRYFRIDRSDTFGGGSLIVMDAPPPQEDVRPFVTIAAMIRHAGLNAPAPIEQDLAQGFLLLTDLGSWLYLDALNAARAAGDETRIAALMRDAITALVRWQRDIDPGPLPPYDETLLRRELALFPEWCVEREFGTLWSEAQRSDWQSVCDRLVVSALAQPTVAVHRDWMPRNLMVAEPNPGILDFQDAVRGPITYDIASMLRDAFISWDEPQEIDWAVRYWEAARVERLPVPGDFGEFWRTLEWMGLQRHLKVLGIFCRLKHRDGKPRYSTDLPRFFAYAHKVATRYRDLAPLVRLIEPLMGEQRIDAFY